MSFVEQEDVFQVVEKLMVSLFKNFPQYYLSGSKISYSDSMEGTEQTNQI